MSDTWDPAQYHDTFHDDIMALVDRKIRAGKTEEITEVEAPHESRQSADILDLSDLLKRSLGRGKGKRQPAAASAPRTRKTKATPKPKLNPPATMPRRPAKRLAPRVRKPIAQPRWQCGRRPCRDQIRGQDRVDADGAQAARGGLNAGSAHG